MSEMDETLEIFFSEAEELLKSAEESLLALESTPDSSPDIEQLFRSVHTMKSSAAMVGFMGISEYAHLLENLLERLRNRKLTVTHKLITFLLDSVDFIRSMVDSVLKGKPEAVPEVLNDRKSRVKPYLGIEGVSSSEEKEEAEPRAKGSGRDASDVYRFYMIDLNFGKQLFHSGQDPLLILFNLSELGEFVQIVPDLSGLPDFGSLSMYDLYISWQIVMKTRRSIEEIEDVFMFVMDDHDIRIEDVTNRYRDGIDVGLASKRLGEVLLEKSKITEEVLTDALKKQKMLGEILVEEGKVGPDDVKRALSLQEESRTVYRKTTIRVDVEKIDSLVNLGEEIGIGLSKMQALLERPGGPEPMALVEDLEDLVKVNREFQERVARVRMFPLEGTFRRFQRMARDLAIQQNKKINVILTGLDTELDKEVIEHFTDPMKHLVRNCVDHGIESPEERVAKGKPATGSIELRAYQRGGRVFVEIREDGRGIDLAAVREKAVDHGWLRPEESVTEEQLLAFIFKPGFSTSSEVTELSGRGVGMDVVKTELHKLGGTIGVRTEKDKGTSFVLCLPLISALMEVLHVVVDGKSYLVPVQAVIGTDRCDDHLVKRVGVGKEVYPFRGDYLPLVDIAKVLATPGTPTNGRGHILVFVDTGRKIFGLPVDQLLEPQQIIVKSLETNYRSVRGLAGASILGDGSISLVLDLLGIEEIFFREPVKGDGDHESEQRAGSI
jgi:two-component system chemotaxis sensor kinase CheA